MADWVTRRYHDLTVTVWERRGNNPDGSPKHVRIGQEDIQVTRLNETVIRSRLRAMGYELGGREISWHVNATRVYGVPEDQFLAKAVPVERAKNGTVHTMH